MSCRLQAIGFRMVVTTLLLFAIASTSAQKPEYKEAFYSNGKLRYKGYFIGKTPVGEVTRYYWNGKPEAVLDHQGDTTKATLYSQNGDHYTRGTYIGRKKDGQWEYYYLERLLIKETYTRDTLNGEWVRFNREGDTLEMKNWKMGYLSGPRVLYYDNGKKRFESFYLHGKMEGPVRSYTYEGVLSLEGSYKNNLKEGCWRYYDHKDELTKEILYKSGIPENADELQERENKELDELISDPGNFADPSRFVNEPEIFLKLVE